MTLLRHLGCTFLSVGHPRPNSRIGLQLFVALFLVVGAACDKLLDKSPTAPPPVAPPSPGSAIVYTAVGASDATGHGATVECIPFDNNCNGNGYVHVAVRQLRARAFTVTLRNLGIPTAAISRAFQQLGQQYNHPTAANYLDQEMPFIKNDTTVVTVFAGGNEVNIITAALGGGAGGSDPAGYIDTQVRAFGNDYATLIAGIRTNAPSARIVVLNLPNLAGLPRYANVSLPQRQAAQRASVGMTTTVINRLTTSQNVVAIIDLMCDPRAYMPSNYSADGFHPNDSGYAFIAAEIVTAITSSSYPAPRTSCSQMTIVP